MTRSLDARRVVMTGALGGIGVTTMRALKNAGARVQGIDLQAGADVEADVADRGEISAAIEGAAERLGGIDILINNAGIGCAQDSGDFPHDAGRRAIEVNLFGAWNATAAALPHLLRSRGHVINVSSGLALVDVPWAAAYTASKRGLEAYSNALRLEYGDRIAVTSVYPGYIRTAIHDGPAAAGATLDGVVRADTVEQAARAMVRACMTRPRSIATSPLSTVELWAARRFPRVTRSVLERRFRRWRATTRPTFLRFPS